MTRRTISWLATMAFGVLGSTSAKALESGFYIGAIGGQTSIDAQKHDFDDFARYSGAVGFSSSFDDSDAAFGLVLGGQFGRWFAVEAQLLNLGEYTYKASQTRPNWYPTAPRNLDVRDKVTVEAAALSLSGILTIPIGEQFAVGLRLGFAANATATSYVYEERRGGNRVYLESDDDDADASDVGATYGLGFEWAPTEHVGVRLEYQIIKKVGAEDDDYDYDDDFDFDDDEYFDAVAERSGYDLDLISLSFLWRF